MNQTVLRRNQLEGHTGGKGIRIIVSNKSADEDVRAAEEEKAEQSGHSPERAAFHLMDAHRSITASDSLGVCRRERTFYGKSYKDLAERCSRGEVKKKEVGHELQHRLERFREKVGIRAIENGAEIFNSYMGDGGRFEEWRLVWTKKVSA